MGESAQAQSQVASATAQAGQTVANAQQMFARSVAQVAAGFEQLAVMRRGKQDELAVQKWEFNKGRATIEFNTAESENPNPQKLEGKAYLDDVDSRYAKTLEDVTKVTEEELGYKIRGDAQDKVTALSLQGRVQTMEAAASTEHQRQVVQMFEGAKADAIASGQQVGTDGDIGAGIARGEQITARLEGVVSPEKYLAFKEVTKKDAYTQGVRHYLAKGDIATAEAIVSQLTGIAGPGSNEVTASIVDAMKAEGVDAAIGLAISHRETAGTFDPASKTFIDPNTGRRASSASGLFHMTDATARSYLGAANAGDDPIENQAKAGAKLTADNIKGLQRALGTEPSAGDVYLAHVLGLGKAVRVIGSDPDTPLTDVLSAKEIRNSAPGLKNGTVGDMRDWSQDAMRTSAEAVTGAGIFVGKDIPPNWAGLPLDDAATLWKEVETTKKQMADEQEKQNKEYVDAFVPIKPRTERDPAAFVAKYSPVAAKAYGIADAVKANPEATLEQKVEAQTRAYAISIEEQKMLAAARGVPFSERDTKILPVSQAKAIVNSLTEAKGPDAVKAFFAMRNETGSYFAKIHGELVDQGLTPEFQLLGLLDPIQNPAQVNSVAQIIGVSSETLKKDLGSAGSSINTELLDPIEDGLSEFRQAFELGPFGGAKQQASSLIEAAKKVGLNHYRLTGDVGEATRRAVALIDENVDVVTGENIRAIIPREANVSVSDVELATEYMSNRARIDDFDPMPIGVAEEAGTGETAEAQVKFRADRTRDTAMNFGIWTTNDRGDGLTLLVPMGNGTSYTRLFNAKGEPYDIKFSDVPVLAKKGERKLDIPEPQGGLVR
jgi:Mor family transcriptional regulator